MKYTKLAYNSPDELTYGKAIHPVTAKNGIIVGGDIIYPEVNFTVPPMNVTKDTMPEVMGIYKEIITGVLDKAIDLHQDGICIEFETLPEMTMTPQWAIDIHKLLRDTMFDYEANKGLKSCIRMTPNDLREFNRPMVLRSGPLWESMHKVFEQTARDGADFLSIESTGGKEICDGAIVNADIRTAIFALACMGSRDMAWLWSNITDIANKNGSIPGGDSACGFGNTAMVLAEQGFIPKIFATLMRVATVPRALTAIENGAVGPSKDCAYEGIFLKAITGTPIALEGKTCACAHFSPIGNIAFYSADLWSNESVQQVKLLSGFAPTVYTEQLIYDCRMMNTARQKGADKIMRDILIDSDAYLDPQAYILRPECVFEICNEIIKTEDAFSRTVNGVKKTLEILRRALEKGELKVDEREAKWLDMLEDQLDEIPDDEAEFIEEMRDEINSEECDLNEYGL